jgi:hypothetical protein
MSGLFSETVTLCGRGDVVGHTSTNDPIYGPPRRVEAPGWVEAGFGEESIDARDQVSRLFTLWLDGNLVGELEAYDDVEYRGESFHIAGDVAFQPGGAVVPGWTNARLKKIKG